MWHSYVLLGTWFANKKAVSNDPLLMVSVWWGLVRVGLFRVGYTVQYDSMMRSNAWGLKFDGGHCNLQCDGGFACVYSLTWWNYSFSWVLLRVGCRVWWSMMVEAGRSNLMGVIVFGLHSVMPTCIRVMVAQTCRPGPTRRGRDYFAERSAQAFDDRLGLWKRAYNEPATPWPRRGATRKAPARLGDLRRCNSSAMGWLWSVGSIQ